jgi:cell wall-associated NlpC family hydrolase
MIPHVRKWSVPAGLVAVALVLTAAVFVFAGTAGATPLADATTSTTTPLVLQGEALDRVKALIGQATDVQSQIDALDVELERRTEAYNELVVKLDRTNAQLTELRRRVAQAQADYQGHVEKLEERIRSVYKSGGRDSLLPMLFLAEGVEDLYNRIVLISQLAEQDAQLLSGLQESKSALDSLLLDIETQKQAQLSLRREQQRERQQIQTQLLERKAMLSSIDTQVAQVLADERQRQAEEEERVRQAMRGLLDGGRVYTGPLPRNGDMVIDQLIETAAFYQGVPYVWAGDRPSTGFDCSGFTQFVFAQHGVELPHYSGYQAQLGMPVNLPDLQAGDLLCFGSPVHHVGIYIGDGLFIHAPRTGDVVRIQPLAERTNLSDIRRFQLQFRVGAPLVR